jgi:GT2 family glycosyltransferase
LNKIIARLAKEIIGRLPPFLKRFLRKSPRLLAWYTLVVDKSGYRRSVTSSSHQFLDQEHCNDLYLTYINSVNKVKENEICCVNDCVLLLVPTSCSTSAELATLESVISCKVPFTEVIYFRGDKKNSEEFSLKLCEIEEHVTIIDKIPPELVNQLAGKALVILYLGHRLHPDFLFFLNYSVNTVSDLAYTDSDFIDESGQRCSPCFYPDWDPEFQLATGYVNSGVWFKEASIALHALSLSANPRFFLTQFMCELALDNKDLIVQHIPCVLLHKPLSFEGAFDSARLDFWQHLAKKVDVTTKVSGKVLALKWKLETSPMVSLVIPTKNSKDLVKACIESILTKTIYQNYEILLVDNNSNEIDSLEYFSELSLHPKVTLLRYPKSFNYSAINNFAVKHARGDVIGLINNDVEVISPDWLEYMLGHVMRDGVGCVGAKLLFHNGLIQHAGVVMGYGGGAGHAHKYFPRYHSGYLNRLIATSGFSAITAACLLVKKVDYDAVGGLNDVDLTIAFNDVDFCLKVLKLGRRNILCAEAELYHHESISRGSEDTLSKQKRFRNEVAYLQANWADIIESDPAYNPNLTLKYENFSIKEFD